MILPPYQFWSLLFLFIVFSPLRVASFSSFLCVPLCCVFLLFFTISDLFLSLCDRHSLFLEYSSLLLFGSFNEGNRRSIPLFGNGIVRRECSFLHFSLKTFNFCSPQNWEECEGMDLGLMKFLLKPLKYPFNISHSFLNQP